MSNTNRNRRTAPVTPSLEDVLAASTATTGDAITEVNTAEGAQQSDSTENSTAESASAEIASDSGSGESDVDTVSVDDANSDTGPGPGVAGDGVGDGNSDGGPPDSREDDDTILARMIAEEEEEAANAIEVATLETGADVELTVSDESPASSDTDPMAYDIAVNYETVDAEPTDQERLPWLFNYGANRLSNVPQSTTQLWQAFCVDFPEMIGYARMSPDATLVPHRHRDLFAARTVEPELYEPEE